MKRSSWIVIAATMVLSVVVAGAQADDRLNQALDAPVNLQFENAHLNNICSVFDNKYGINILTDEHVVSSSGFKTSESHVTDGRVQYVNLKDVAAREALHAILHPLGLTYSVKETYVWVTTPERIDTKPYSDMDVQIFQVPAGKAAESDANAFGEPNVIALLRKVVPRVADPDTGELLSYMRYNLETNQLVVKNTPENLDTIEELFDLISDDSQPKQQ